MFSKLIGNKYFVGWIWRDLVCLRAHRMLISNKKILKSSGRIFFFLGGDKIQFLLKEEKTNKDSHLPYEPLREFQASCDDESKKT